MRMLWILVLFPLVPSAEAESANDCGNHGLLAQLGVNSGYTCDGGDCENTGLFLQVGATAQYDCPGGTCENSGIFAQVSLAGEVDCAEGCENTGVWVVFGSSECGGVCVGAHCPTRGWSSEVGVVLPTNVRACLDEAGASCLA